MDKVGFTLGLATNQCAKMKGGMFSDDVGIALGLAFEELECLDKVGVDVASGLVAIVSPYSIIFVCLK